MSDVTLTINGRSYRVACEDGQENELYALGNEMKLHVENLVRSFGQIGESRLLLMAGLMMADDLTGLRKKFAGIENQNSTVNQLQKQDEELAKALDQLTTRIEWVTKKVAS